MTNLPSLEDFDLCAASDRPVEMEYVGPNGEKTGFVLQVLGAHSEAVTRLTKELENENRRRKALAEMRRQRGKAGELEYTPIEEDIDYVQKLQAVRIAGWRGVRDEYTPERAVSICKRNPHLAQQVLDFSADLGNFTLGSPTK